MNITISVTFVTHWELEVTAKTVRKNIYKPQLETLPRKVQVVRTEEKDWKPSPGTLTKPASIDSHLCTNQIPTFRAITFAVQQ